MTRIFTFCAATACAMAASPAAMAQATSEAEFRARVEMAAELVRQNVTVRLSQHQFDAVVSLAVTAPAALQPGASRFLHHLNNGRFDAAAREFERWTHVNGQSQPELVERRRSERRLFVEGAYGRE